MTTNIVIVSWPEASRAYRAMTEIRNQASMRVAQGAVIERAVTGAFSVRDEASNTVGLGALGGGVFGSLIGILGGPLGVLLGFSGGALFGSLVDLDQQVDNNSVLAAMSRAIGPGQTALVLQVDEDSTEVLDTLVQASGGTLMRRPLAEVQAEIASAEEAARAAAKEASRVLHEQKKAEHKAWRETKWNEVKAKFNSAFA